MKRLHEAKLVLLALSPEGAAAAIEVAAKTDASVWVGIDGLSDAEYDAAGQSGISISRFVYPLHGASTSTIEKSVETVLQHHPQAIVWVERSP